MYVINTNECLSYFRLSLTKIENQTLSLFTYCVAMTHISFLVFVKFVKMMNFFIKRGKE